MFVRLSLQVIIQNDGDFADVILLYLHNRFERPCLTAVRCSSEPILMKLGI
jgi:hypothetical protein